MVIKVSPTLKKCIAIVFIVLLLQYVLYRTSTSNFQTEEHIYPRNNTKYILYWTSMLNSPNFHFFDNGSDLFKSCPFSNCFATSNRELLPIHKFDALLFYAPTKDKKRKDLPERRSPHQRYIFSSLETPIRFQKYHSQYILNNFYNWTMTTKTVMECSRGNTGFICRLKIHIVRTTQQKNSSTY